MQSPLANSFNISPFGGGEVPSAAMVVYAAVYIAVALVLACRFFGKRDL